MLSSISFLLRVAEKLLKRKYNDGQGMTYKGSIASKEKNQAMAMKRLENAWLHFPSVQNGAVFEGKWSVSCIISMTR